MNESGIDLLGASKQTHNLLKSKYPIVSALMNQVSELSLALAVSRAGGFPSISSYCYSNDSELISDLESFVAQTGSSNLILGVDEKNLLNLNLVKTIKELKITHILRYFNEDPKISEHTRNNWRVITENILKDLQSVKIEMKTDFKPITDLDKLYFVKGNDGAGRPGNASTKELFDFHIIQTPNAQIVPMGGISTPEQVNYYISNGAVAVGCGTVFAAAKESVLSKAAKEALIAAESKSLTTVDENLKQQGLVFSKAIIDNPNNTASLKLGLFSDTSVGIIFAGKGVDNIKKIEPVEAIINNLASKLR